MVYICEIRAKAQRAHRGPIFSTRVKDMSEQKKVYSHIIRERWCKGCGICVAFCPKQVLALVKRKVAAVRPGDCIGCKMCELRCPDFAIEIKEEGAAASKDAAPSSPDYCLPPEACNA